MLMADEVAAAALATPSALQPAAEQKGKRRKAFSRLENLRVPRERSSSVPDCEYNSDGFSKVTADASLEDFKAQLHTEFREAFSHLEEQTRDMVLTSLGSKMCQLVQENRLPLQVNARQVELEAFRERGEKLKLHMRVDELESQIAEARLRVPQLEEENAELKQEAAALRDGLEKSEKEVQEKQAAVDALKAEVASLEEELGEMETWMKKAEAMIAMLENTSSGSHIEIDDSAVKLEESPFAVLAKVRSQCADLKMQNRQLEEMACRLEERVKGAEEEAAAMVQDAQLEVDMLKLKLRCQELTDEVAPISEAEQMQLDEVRALCFDLQTQKIETEKRAEEADMRLQEAIERCDALQQQVQQSQAECARLEIQIRELEERAISGDHVLQETQVETRRPTLESVGLNTDCLESVGLNTDCLETPEADDYLESSISSQASTSSLASASTSATCASATSELEVVKLQALCANLESRTQLLEEHVKAGEKEPVEMTQQKVRKSKSLGKVGKLRQEKLNARHVDDSNLLKFIKAAEMPSPAVTDVHGGGGEDHGPDGQADSRFLLSL